MESFTTEKIAESVRKLSVVTETVILAFSFKAFNVPPFETER